MTDHLKLLAILPSSPHPKLTGELVFAQVNIKGDCYISEARTFRGFQYISFRGGVLGVEFITQRSIYNKMMPVGEPYTLSMLDEPLAISHQGRSSEGWTVTLRSSPRLIEPASVNQVFWLAQSETLGQESSRWISNSLENSLSMDVVVNHGLEISLPENEFVDEHF
jgi:hypothetical protein